jgi:hypothetical protein
LKKTVGLVIGLLVVAALTLAIVPTSRDEIHWRWADHEDKTESYELYVKSWPAGRHAAEAKARYDDHCWAEATAANTVQLLERYIQLQGEGKHVREARDRIESLELKLALGENSPSLLRDFVNKHPKSSLLENALRNLISLEDIAWGTARQNNTMDSYKHYLGDHPDGGHVNDAKARILVLEFDSGFGMPVKFTDEQMRTYMERLENETYTTVIEKPLEYYEIKPGRSGFIKRKVVVEPSPDQKACSIHLEAGNLSITAIYISSPPISPPPPPMDRPLFAEKWHPTMTHNGSAGPGLEIECPPGRLRELEKFLDTFAIAHRAMISATTYGEILGYVVPDLLWGSDEDGRPDSHYGHVNGRPYPHYGDVFKLETENRENLFKVDGVPGMPYEAITTYNQALALKTYLKIRANE